MIKKIILSFVLALIMFGCATSNTTSNENLAGSYQDRTSQRATMEVEKEGDSFYIVVRWANSAEEYVEWEMNASLKGKKLSYSNCTKKIVDNEESTTDYENGKGYFEVQEDQLYWTGASDDNCKECVFEKID